MCNHNHYYHDLLMQECPTNAQRALDVGCGLGLLARKPATRVSVVDALDADRAILESAISSTNASNIHFIHGDFLRADLDENSYDFITVVAALHHMELGAALFRIKSLLRSGGVVAVLGLYRESTPLDFAYSVISVPWSLTCRAFYREPPDAHPILIRSPETTLSQIREAADAILPGNRLRQHLLWRYSLIWRKTECESSDQSYSVL